MCVHAIVLSPWFDLHRTGCTGLNYVTHQPMKSMLLCRITALKAKTNSPQNNQEIVQYIVDKALLKRCLYFNFTEFTVVQHSLCVEQKRD